MLCFIRFAPSTELTARGYPVVIDFARLDFVVYTAATGAQVGGFLTAATGAQVGGFLTCTTAVSAACAAAQAVSASSSTSSQREQQHEQQHKQAETQNNWYKFKLLFYIPYGG